MELDLKTLETSELEGLLQSLTVELASRRNPTPLVRVKIWLGAASGGREGWCKKVTSLDPRQRGGYAFVGEFLKPGLYDLPSGTLVLDVYPTGSARNGGKGATLWVVESDQTDGLKKIAQTDDWLQKSLVILDAAQKHLNK